MRNVRTLHSSLRHSSELTISAVAFICWASAASAALGSREPSRVRVSALRASIPGANMRNATLINMRKRIEFVDDAVKVLREMPADMQATAALAILDYASNYDAQQFSDQ